MKHRDYIRWQKRGSRARRSRMTWRRRSKAGYLFWAPLPKPGERPPCWPTGWVSLGATEEGYSETFRGPALDYVIVDEVQTFTPWEWERARGLFSGGQVIKVTYNWHREAE